MGTSVRCGGWALELAQTGNGVDTVLPQPRRAALKNAARKRRASARRFGCCEVLFTAMTSNARRNTRGGRNDQSSDRMVERAGDNYQSVSEERWRRNQETGYFGPKNGEDDEKMDG